MTMTTTTTNNTTPHVDPAQLVERALSTIDVARVPDDLAERAFAAAMRVPQQQSLADRLSDAFGDLFAVARVGAVCAAGIAAILVVATATTTTTNNTTKNTSTLLASNDDDAWVSAVLPLTVDEEAL